METLLLLLVGYILLLASGFNRYFVFRLRESVCLIWNSLFEEVGVYVFNKFLFLCFLVKQGLSLILGVTVLPEEVVLLTQYRLNSADLAILEVGLHDITWLTLVDIGGLLAIGKNTLQRMLN